MDALEQRYWLALWRAPGVGPATFRAIVDAAGSPREAFAAPAALGRTLNLREPTLAYLRQPDWNAVAQDERWLEGDQCHLLVRGAVDYPQRLAEIADPPPLLFVLGDPALLSFPQLAMVGSRNPTPSGAQTAFEFARALAGAGLVITSGLASGIDAACHRGALESGSTVAVMGTGPDRVYPASQRPLAHAIAERGALVTEWPVGTPAQANNFPRRNRLISGLSLGTLVVEAARKSGSLITARLALEQGREVLAMPGSIHSPLARGCNALIREGAKLVETVEDVLEEIAPGLVAAHPVSVADSRAEDADPSGEGHAALLQWVAWEPTSVDTLAAVSGLPVEEVASMLLILELQGRVAALPGGCYQRLHYPRHPV